MGHLKVYAGPEPSARGAAAGAARRRRDEPQEQEGLSRWPTSSNRSARLRDALTDAQARRAAGAAAAEPAKPKLDAQGRAYATGKRKNAVARVWIKPGTGKITVNGRDSPVYFARPVLRMLINQPFGVADRLGQFDVVCTVEGRRPLGPGRRGAPRHQQGADLLRAGPAPGARSTAASSPATAASSSARSTARPRPAAASSSRSADARHVCVSRGRFGQTEAPFFVLT